MKHISIALGALLIFALCVYHTWFFSLGIISNGDRGYLPNLLNGHHALYVWRSVMSFGDVVLDLGQWSRQLFPMLGRLGMNYALAERIIFLRPSVLCATIGFFFLGQRIWQSTRAGVVASLVFCYSTYFLTLQTGHTTLAMGFSLFAFIWLAYDTFLSTKNIARGIVTLLLFFLCLGYEPRAGYIMAGILALMTLFWFARPQQHKSKVIGYLVIGGIIMVLLNLWWVLPLSHSLGNITDNELFNRGLFGNEFFDILYALTLHHPRWDGVINKAFVNQQIPLYFWLLPVLAWGGFFVHRKNRTMQFFAVLALLGIFLSKQVAPPGGFIYKLLFEYFPGFSAFREASKFYVLIAMSYSVMISGGVARLWQQRKLRLLFRCVIGFLMLFSVWNTRSYISGDIESLFVTKTPSPDYTRLNNFLSTQEGYGRTLVVPKYSRWLRYTSDAPRISLADELRKKLKHTGYTGSTAYAKIHSLFQLSGADVFMDDLAVRYVVLPMVDDANKDNFYTNYGKQENEFITLASLTGTARKEKLLALSKQAHQDYYELLRGAPFLKEVDLGMTDGTHIFENTNYTPLLSVNTGSVVYMRSNPTFYSVEISVPAGVTGVTLSFMESYNPGWELFPRRSSFPCVTPKVSEGNAVRGVVTECIQQGNTFFPSEVMKYRSRKTTIGSTHPRIAGYAQAWNIHLPQSADTITLRYDLIFRPQARLYPGLFISGFTLFVLLLLSGRYIGRIYRKPQK